MTIQLTLPIVPLSIKPVTLTGRATRLEPMSIEHARGLFLAASQDIFHFLYIQPSPWTEAGFGAYARTLLTDPNRVPFTIVHQPSGQIIGSSSFLNIRPKDQAVEIGTTWFNTAHWGTTVNPEIKFLMLRHMFETLRVQRVTFRVDARNSRSLSAVRKLGAMQEGVIRRDSIDRFAVCRDMVQFSIIPEEWPGIRSRLIERLTYEP